MPQSQIMSYLLTGKSVDSITGSETKSFSAARDQLAVQGGGFLASQLGRRIGIEEVGVESTVNSAGEANTSLVLGKFLSPRLFVSYGLRLAAIGIGCGLMAAFALGRVMASLLFEVSPVDPAVLAATAAAVVALTTVASLVPAWRVMRVDPTTALRSE